MCEGSLPYGIDGLARLPSPESLYIIALESCRVTDGVSDAVASHRSAFVQRCSDCHQDLAWRWIGTRFLILDEENRLISSLNLPLHRWGVGDRVKPLLLPASSPQQVLVEMQRRY